MRDRGSRYISCFAMKLLSKPEKTENYALNQGKY